MSTSERAYIRKMHRGVGFKRQLRHMQEKHFGLMKVSRNNARIALSHQSVLEEGVADLMEKAAAADSNSDLDLAHLRETLNKLQTAVQGLGEHFSNSLDPSFYTEREPSDSAKTVFETPELLEKIMLQLPPSDILRTMAVNKQFSTAIEHSVKLQRELSLQTYTDRFRVPFENMMLCGLTFETELVGPEVLNQGNTYRVLLQISSHFDVKLGDRIRNMHITHPPTTRALVAPTCCGGWGLSHQAILNSAGIRLGELNDACKAVRKQHWECFQAAQHCQRAGGKFDTTIICNVGVQVARSHPLAIEGMALDRSQQRAAAATRLMNGYHQLKRTIQQRAPRSPLPTMQQARLFNFDPAAWIANNP